MHFQPMVMADLFLQNLTSVISTLGLQPHIQPLPRVDSIIVIHFVLVIGHGHHLADADILISQLLKMF